MNHLIPKRLLGLFAALFLFTGACAVVMEVETPTTEDHTGHIPEDAIPPLELTPRDGAPLGANTLAYLRAEYPRLVIEIDAVEGRGPEPSSVSHFVSVLESVLDKPDGIEVVRNTIPTPTQDRYAVQDFLNIERQHRDSASGGDTVSMYLLFLDGESVEHPGVVGVSYSASAFVIFKDRIEASVGPVGSVSAVERSVMVHEAGHLLRLVNLGYESPRDRESEEYPHHSANEESVMYWAVQSAQVGGLLGETPPDDFDEDDRADLDDLREGRFD